MAVTGLSFIGFLAVHLVGNFFLYAGRESFNSYVEHLHKLGVLINFAELGLLMLAAIHILTAIYLYFENLAARPVKYVMKQNAGGRTLASSIMPYTGAYILFFVIVHLINFRFIDQGSQTMFDVVSQAFANPFYALFYTLSVVVTAFHVSHGFWSAFQTLGLFHPKYTPAINRLGLVFALVVGIGFGLIPIYKLVV